MFCAPLVAHIVIAAKITDDRHAVLRGLRFLRTHLAAALACSALVIIPCFWHRRLEAGDLPSHTYSAWLSQLIQQGRAPGLYSVHQWTNTLFDLLLSFAVNIFGFDLGPKIAVAICVLMFFWGIFSFVSVVSGRTAWPLAPVMAMLTYGYTFNMGFFNYYLSIGLACLALAILWRTRETLSSRPGNWDVLCGVCLLVLAMFAHPIGPLWCLATLFYVSLRNSVTGPWRFCVPVGAVSIFITAHFLFVNFATLEIGWPDKPFYMFNGADQFVVYSVRYHYIAIALVVLLASWLALNVYQRFERATLNTFLLLAELYLVSFCIIATLPQDIRLGLYAAWIGLLVSRLTLISAILALAAAGTLKPGKLVFSLAILCAALFFTLLYRDTAGINLLEQHAEQLVATLPEGTRVIPTLAAHPDSRIPFVGHVVDRACISHCFTYSNYEPSSLQFRVRVATGSPLVTASAGDSQEMEAGNYMVQPADPPLVDIYQCSPTDSTILCARKLAVGDKTGEPVDADE